MRIFHRFHKLIHVKFFLFATKYFGYFSAEIHSPDRIILKADTIALPLAAGLIGNRLQARKEHPLQQAGYNYGDTLWGTGEGWGYFSGVSQFIIEEKHHSVRLRSMFQDMLH
jgi:hypothetical protein